jgi:hypothetical protein
MVPYTKKLNHFKDVIEDGITPFRKWFTPFSLNILHGVEWPIVGPSITVTRVEKGYKHPFLLFYIILGFIYV